MSVTFRDVSNNTSNQHQWIVLDGDIDAGAARRSSRLPSRVIAQLH